MGEESGKYVGLLCDVLVVKSWGGKRLLYGWSDTITKSNCCLNQDICGIKEQPSQRALR